MTCTICHNTGLRYEGTGHRMGGYPFAESHTTTECTCAAGDALVKERKDAAARRELERDAIEDYIAQKREEQREATRRMELDHGLRFCPKCNQHQPQAGFQGFDICGECLDKTVIKEK